MAEKNTTNNMTYIYEVNYYKTMRHKKPYNQRYFLNAEDTHHVWDLHWNTYFDVKLVRVMKNSVDYQLAEKNSQDKFNGKLTYLYEEIIKQKECCDGEALGFMRGLCYEGRGKLQYGEWEGESPTHVELGNWYISHLNEFHLRDCCIWDINNEIGLSEEIYQSFYQTTLVRELLWHNGTSGHDDRDYNTCKENLEHILEDKSNFPIEKHNLLLRNMVRDSPIIMICPDI